MNYLAKKQGPRVQIQIQNVVATGDLNQRLDLESILRVAPEAKYEPEKFPGLVYRMDEPNVVILIFTSGKLVIAGAKRKAEVRLAAEKLKETLDKNRLISYRESSRRHLRGFMSTPTRSC